jgi:hypothetical protein
MTGGQRTGLRAQRSKARVATRKLVEQTRCCRDTDQVHPSQPNCSCLRETLLDLSRSRFRERGVGINERPEVAPPARYT